MNFAWGKVYLYSFCLFAILSLPKMGVIGWIVAGCFFVSICFNIFLHVKYKHLELEKVREKIEKIQARNYPDAEAEK